MFANPTSKVGISQQVVATLVAFAVTLLSIGVYASTANAASLVDVSDTLTDSAPSNTSNHSIAFSIPTGSELNAASSITITLPSTPGSGFIINNLESGDITATVNAGGATVDSLATTTTTIILSLDTTANAGEEVVVAIGNNKITNPDTTGSTEIEVATTEGDNGKTRVVIIDQVIVSAIVDTVFDFTITGIATSTTVNGTSTTGSTTPTAVNFGTISANGVYNLGQRLNVTTNARSGFIVTVQSDGDLRSANGAVIDNFDDGSDVADTGTLWTSPFNDVNDDQTWGHWGISSGDSDIQSNNTGSAYSDNFGADEFIAASTTPREIFHHTGPADGTTADIGSTTVLYRVEITPLQEAADDYQTILTYIATPTF